MRLCLCLFCGDPRRRLTRAAERHRLHEKVDIDLIDRAPAEGQFADEAIYRILIAAEDERRQRMRCGRDPVERLVKRPVGQDG